MFRHCFEADFRTLLIGGASEPFYQPAKSSGDVHRLYYREDYIRSALHEVAHWCIAGEKRRRLPDFGYWYHPDGRTPDQQLNFERVEVKPQALEQLFCQACGIAFEVSTDNLNGSMGLGSSQKLTFAARVDTLAQELRMGPPARAQTWINALTSQYG